MCPPHYNNFSKPNLSGRGEGTAVVFKDSFICFEQSVAIFYYLFEVLYFKVLDKEHFVV